MVLTDEQRITNIRASKKRWVENNREKFNTHMRNVMKIKNGEYYEKNHEEKKLYFKYYMRKVYAYKQIQKVFLNILLD